MVFGADDGLYSNQTRIVHETADGSFLVVCTGGLNIIRDDRVIGGYGQADGISNPESLTVCTAPNGDIVLGSNGDGVYIINERGIRCITTQDGLSSGVVMRIKYDPAREIFWLITGNAIVVMNTDYEVKVISRFPYANNFDLYENSQGYMWVLSGSGIYVASAEELLTNKDVNPAHFSIANGLPFITTSNSYSALTPDGELYIAGNSGVIKVNIDAPTEEIGDLKIENFKFDLQLNNLNAAGFLDKCKLNNTREDWYKISSCASGLNEADLTSASLVTVNNSSGLIKIDSKVNASAINLDFNYKVDGEAKNVFEILKLIKLNASLKFDKSLFDNVPALGELKSFAAPYVVDKGDKFEAVFDCAGAKCNLNGKKFF